MRHFLFFALCGDIRNDPGRGCETGGLRQLFAAWRGRRGGKREEDQNEFPRYGLEGILSVAYFG